MIRFFRNLSPNLTSPAQHIEAITPADGTDLTFATRGIYVGTGGDLRVLTLGGDTVTFPDVPAGVILPIRCKRVLATSTTASGIVGLA